MADFLSKLDCSFELDQGTLIEVEVAVAEPRASALRKDNRPVPGPFLVTANVDTGATGTAIDLQLVEKLGVPFTNFTRHRTASGPAFAPLCYVDIMVPTHPIPWSVNHHPCSIFKDLNAGGFHVLLGLDILRSFTFRLDGPDMRFSLLLPSVPNTPPPEVAVGNGSAYYDAASRCFYRLEAGKWQPYVLPKPGLFKRLVGRT